MKKRQHGYSEIDATVWMCVVLLLAAILITGYLFWGHTCHALP